MARPAKMVVHLDALRHNFQVVKHCTLASVASVVKSNAYGHGAVQVAKVLEEEGTDALAVACIEEALDLRESGIRSPIILLEGCFEESELALVEQYHLTTLLQNTEQVDCLLAYQPKSPLNVWIKIDTGLHRQGFSPQAFKKEYVRIKNCPHINKVVIATHFSSADAPSNGYTHSQLQCFRKSIKDCNDQVSLSASAAILHDYQTQDDWVRPGLMLTGISPFKDDLAIQSMLKPVMELTANIIDIQELPAGVTVGYSNTYTTKEATRIGVVAIGYGDGYPQNMPCTTPVLINNKRSHLMGRVAMDTIGVNLANVPEAKIGTTVTLWSDKLLVSEIATHANTISYALMAGLLRVKREYVG